MGTTLPPRNAEIPADYLCDLCKKEPATLNWSESATMFARGYKQQVCYRCAVTAQLAHARESAAAIPALEAQLREIEARAGK